jgi:hypothetical protein
MPTCGICGEELPEGARTCAVCGTSLHEVVLPTASVITPAEHNEKTQVFPIPPMPPDGRYCPSCRQVYGPEYPDTFCVCGIELLRAPPPPPPPPMPSPSPAIPQEATTVKVRASRPAPGTPCLTLFGPDREPLQYFALTRDATLIGRLDALAGVFPDIDLDEWLEPAQARKVSRQHALVLRHRAQGSFSLRPLTGNTGTQLETDMVLPLQDYPLQPGHRLILGGVVRLKFEIA